MSKLKIERGASKVRRAPLKATIDGTVADDLELMREWSENDLSYIVNRLLDFAIGQSEDFQKYKAERSVTPMTARSDVKPVLDQTRKAMQSVSGSDAQSEKGASA